MYGSTWPEQAKYEDSDERKSVPVGISNNESHNITEVEQSIEESVRHRDISFKVSGTLMTIILNT